MPRQDYAGNAKPTVLAGGISATDLAIVISDATGWPSGGPSGKFFVTLNRAASTEERVLIASRTGTTLTIANVGDRGVDDTLAAIHNSGETIEHTYSAVDADVANAHIFDTTRDDHSQYLNLARHADEALHSFGAGEALGVPGAPAAIGTVAGAGNGARPARENHVHILGTGSIFAAAMFAAGVVDAAAIAPDAVGTSELAPDAVTSAELADNAVGTEHIQADSVGQSELGALSVGTPEIQLLAIITALLADDSVTAPKVADGAIDAAAKIVNAIITLNKFASEAATSYVPVFQGLSGGSNTVYGRSFKIGRIVVGWFGFSIGAGGNILAEINVSLPFPSANVGANYICAFRAVHPSTGARAGGMGLITPNSSLGEAFSTFGADPWDLDSPWNWEPGDSADGVFIYEAAT